MDFAAARSLLQSFKFTELFVRHLGWNYGNVDRKYPLNVDGTTYYRQDIAELSGVRVFEISSPSGDIPNAQNRGKIAEEISQICAKNLIVFTDKHRIQSIWYWRQQNGQRFYPREHLYVKQQAGDLLLSKLTALEFSLNDFEAGKDTVFDIAQRLEKGFDVEKVTQVFYREFDGIHEELIAAIQGIDNKEDRR